MSKRKKQKPEDYLQAIPNYDSSLAKDLAAIAEAYSTRDSSVPPRRPPPKPKHTPYFEKLKDPRWQRMRLEVMARENYTCQHCGDKTTTLNVHHMYYERGNAPWEYPPDSLECLCEPCHERAEGDRLHLLKILARVDRRSRLKAIGFVQGMISVWNQEGKWMLHVPGWGNDDAHCVIMGMMAYLEIDTAYAMEQSRDIYSQCENNAVGFTEVVAVIDGDDTRVVAPSWGAYEDATA